MFESRDTPVGVWNELDQENQTNSVVGVKRWDQIDFNCNLNSEFQNCHENESGRKIVREEF